MPDAKKHLSDPPLLILASLAKGRKHGHAILLDIDASYGTRLGPGTLYGAIARLEQDGLIKPLPGQGRRKPYEITDKGSQLLKAELTAIGRLTGAETISQSCPVEELTPPIPSFYRIAPKNELMDELEQPSTKPSPYGADRLPFEQLGGRRFELLTYLIKCEESSKADVVTLVKSSGDKGRDVLIHSAGALRTIVQCKNLGHKFALPHLLEELVKLALYDYLDPFIPGEGIQYELWAPGGLTEPADRLVANWPEQMPMSNVRTAFDSVARRYKGLGSLTWETVDRQLLDTFAHRIRLQRFDGLHLSQKVRSCTPVFSRFFEGTVVMKKEHVDRYVQTTLVPHLEAHQTQIVGKLSDLLGKNDGDVIDTEINDARDQINNGKFADASVILRRLQSKRQHSLTKHHRYRILSNLAAVAFAEGRLEEAARQFLEAVLLEPNDERARVNEVFAHFLRRDLPKVFAMATERRKQYPHSARLASMWITSAPADTSPQFFEEQLDPALLNDGEVCVALARRAMALNELEKAKKYADSAIAATPKWSQPWLVRAQVYLGDLVAESAGLRAIEPQHRDDLVKAGINDATRAVELSETPAVRAEALVVRCDLLLIAPEIVKATEDAKQASLLEPTSVNALLALAQCHFIARALDRGIEALQEAYAKESRPDIAFMYAKALTDRSQEGDLKRAIEIGTAVDIESLHLFIRPSFAIGILHIIAKTGDWAAAQSYIDKVRLSLPTPTILVLSGLVQHGRGDIEDANTSAVTALKALAPDTDVATKETLAQLLVKLGRPADALPLFQELFDKRIPSFDPARLLDCAARLHLDHRVLEICDELHQRRGPDWHLLEFEVQYLEKYDKNKAIERLQEFLQANPGHKLAQLRLSVIGILHRKPDLIRAAMKDLPSVEELPIEYLGPTLGLMRHGEDRDLVIDYAYRFLRGHFDSQEAHEAYIQAVLTSSERTYPPTLETVAPDAAVLCKEIPNGELRWFVLEDTDRPVRDFEEISLNNPIAAELTGKRVGDKFILARASLVNREAVIEQILPKYVRRFQDCMTQLQVRFGPSAMVQSVQIGSETDLAQPALVSLMTSVQERAKAVAAMQSWYAEQPMSLHIYGSRFGKNSYVALQYIAQTEGMSVQAFDNTSTNPDAAMSALRERPTVVVDLSAIATIRLLGLEWIFGTKQYHFVATTATWEELQDTFHCAEPASEKAGSISYEDGRYVITEQRPEVLARKLAEDDAFLDSFRAAIEIVPARPLAAIEPKTRELLVNYLGQYGAETIAVAGQPQMILWCDDARESQLASTTVGAKYVWTQMILLSLAETGALSKEDYTKAIAKMIGMEFTSVFFDAQCLLQCAKIAEYRAGRSPLKQALVVFERTSSPAKDLIRHFLSFFVLLEQEPVLPQPKSLIVRAFLDSLWRNPSTHGIVLSLRSISTRIFGLNVIAANTFNQIFDVWVRSLTRPIV